MVFGGACLNQEGGEGQEEKLKNRFSLLDYHSEVEEVQGNNWPKGRFLSTKSVYRPLLFLKKRGLVKKEKGGRKRFTPGKAVPPLPGMMKKGEKT